MGFSGGSDVKESACNAGEPDSIPGLGISPGEGNGNPLQYALPGEFHAQRSLVGDSPWGHKESDTTEPLMETSNTIWSKTLHYTYVSLFGCYFSMLE